MTPAHRIVVTGCSPEHAMRGELPGEVKGPPSAAIPITPLKAAGLRGVRADMGAA